MEKKRLRVFNHLALTFLAVMILIALPGCGHMPRIVVLHDPLSAQEHNNLGLAYESKGLYELAEKEYRKAAELEKDWALPLCNAGNAAYSAGDLKSAQKYYRQAIKRDARYADALNNLANVLYELGRRPQARQAIEQALAIEQKDAYLDTYERIGR